MDAPYFSKVGTLSQQNAFSSLLSLLEMLYFKFRYQVLFIHFEFHLMSLLQRPKYQKFYMEELFLRIEPEIHHLYSF